MAKPKVLSFTELEKEMRGKDCLSGYDVLVSYSEKEMTDRLNTQLLTKSYNTLEFESKASGGWGKTVLYENVWNLSNASVSLGGDGEISLTFDLGGSANEKGSTEKHEISAGFTFSLKTKLVHIKGTYKVQDGSPATSATTDFSGSNKDSSTGTVTLNPTEKQAYAVALDLGTDCIATVQTKPGAAVSSDAQQYLDSAAPSCRDYMHSADIIWYMAGVTNQSKDDSATGTQLQPATFRFSTVEADDSAKSALCMWIGVSGGAGNAQASPSFKPGSLAINPIPDGSSASIIFAHDLLANKFFVPGLPKFKPWAATPPLFLPLAPPDMCGADGKVVDYPKCLSVLGNEGMKFETRLPDVSVDIPGKDFSDQSDLYLQGSTIFVGRSVVNITLDPGLADGAIASFSQKFQNDLDWKKRVRYSTPTRDGGAITGYTTYHATCRLELSYTASGAWTDSSATNTIGFKFDIPSTFTKTTEKVGNSNDWAWFNVDVDVPSEWSTLTVKVPSFTCDLGELNYFLTTNLLIPGAHLFNADPVKPSPKSKNKGIATPRDTLLTGSIQPQT